MENIGLQVNQRKFSFDSTYKKRIFWKRFQIFPFLRVTVSYVH